MKDSGILLMIASVILFIVAWKMSPDPGTQKVFNKYILVYVSGVLFVSSSIFISVGKILNKLNGVKEEDEENIFEEEK